MAFSPSRAQVFCRGFGGGGAVVHAPALVPPVAPNVLNPEPHAAGSSFPSSGQYVSTGHTTHVAALVAAVTLL